VPFHILDVNPMSKRRQIALFAVLGLTIAVAGLFALRPREPVYEGRRLTEWLQELDKTPFTKESRDQAIEAVRHIGTNAIPFLEQLLRPDPWWKQKFIELSRKSPKVRLRLTRAARRQRLAVRGIEALGPLAKPLIPMMIELLKEGDVSSKVTAMVSLPQIGSAAVTSLIEALTNANPEVRVAVVACLRSLGTNTPAAVHALVERIESDIHVDVRASAADALGNIKREPGLVVPALIRKLSDVDPTVRSEAASALAQFGLEAKAALPRLRELRADENGLVSDSAAEALNRIDPEASLKADMK
jgi:hypothetical protein